MTKSHHMHRKKAIHMVFRHSFKVKQRFWRVLGIASKIGDARIAEEKIKQ